MWIVQNNEANAYLPISYQVLPPIVKIDHKTNTKLLLRMGKGRRKRQFDLRVMLPAKSYAKKPLIRPHILRARNLKLQSLHQFLIKRFHTSCSPCQSLTTDFQVQCIPSLRIILQATWLLHNCPTVPPQCKPPKGHTVLIVLLTKTFNSSFPLLSTSTHLHLIPPIFIRAQVIFTISTNYPQRCHRIHSRQMVSPRDHRISIHLCHRRCPTRILYPWLPVLLPLLLFTASHSWPLHLTPLGSVLMKDRPRMALYTITTRHIPLVHLPQAVYVTWILLWWCPTSLCLFLLPIIKTTIQWRHQLLFHQHNIHHNIRPIVKVAILSTLLTHRLNQRRCRTPFPHIHKIFTIRLVPCPISMPTAMEGMVRSLFLVLSAVNLRTPVWISRA